MARKIKRRPSWSIAVCPESGKRLCWDNKWRDHAPFGSTSWCVKIFRYPKAAMNAAIRHRLVSGEPGTTIGRVIHLYEGDSMDAAGNVTRAGDKTPDPAEHVVTREHQPTLF